MKKIKYFICLVSFFALWSCTDEEVVKVHNGDIKIIASIPSSRTTYTSENGVTKVNWVEGNAIGLCTSEQGNLKYTAISSGAETEFQVANTKIQVQEGDTVYAYYPFDNEWSSNPKAVSLPDIFSQRHGLMSEQETPLYPIYDFMYASGVVKNNELKLQFKHLFAFLKITIPIELLKEINSEGYKYAIMLRSSEPISLSNGLYDLETGEFSGIERWPWNGIIDYSCQLNYHIKEEDVKDATEVTCFLSILPQTENALLQVCNSYSNLDVIYNKKVPKGGFKAGNVYTLYLDRQAQDALKEKDVEALVDFYNATDGNNWINQDNWFTDKPLYEWYGLNRSEVGFVSEIDMLTDLRLSSNNLKGTLPSMYSYFLDRSRLLRIDGNGLYGKIPKEVSNHPRWQKYGWNVIRQDPGIGGGFDLSEGSNLKISDAEVRLFVRDSTSTVFDILQQNKMTLVVNAGALGYEYLDVKLTDENVNLYLDYHNKGLGMVATVWPIPGYTNEQYINSVKEQQTFGLPTTILWSEGFGIADGEPMSGEYFDNDVRYLGEIFLFDKEGNVISYWMKNGCISESWYIEKIDSTLRAHLGEPEEHPLYSSQYYTSTDYSRDGEVVILQQATVGKGIDIVFLGDGFVDKEMEEGGYYEETMKAAMEDFFAFEPYKTFRNRFNVYTVKAVSGTSVYSDQTVDDKPFAGKDASVVFDYARKVPGIDENRLHVGMIPRPNALMDRSNCAMYEDGSFIAVLYQTGWVLTHEMCGHGFAKLLDEYVEWGWENETISKEACDYLDFNWTNYGWGANVDWRNDVNTVKWAHFLNDSRYANEGLGLYEGAYLYGYGVYRPTYDSMMNSNTVPFNAPSREQIYKCIMQLSEGESWTYDYEEFVKFDEVSRNTASRSAVKPLTEAERQEYIKNHRPPTFIKGTWRNAMKNGKSKIVVPFR